MSSNCAPYVTKVGNWPPYYYLPLVLLAVATSALSQVPGLQFTLTEVYPSETYTVSSSVIADVNGDGKPDVVVVSACDSMHVCSNGVVSVRLGNGDGNFRSAMTYDSGAVAANSVAVGDVNGDGKPDIVVAEVCMHNCSTLYNMVGVLLGNGDGTFQAAKTYSSGGDNGAESVALADLNGDGKIDIVVANYCAGTTPNCPSSTNGGVIGVLLGNGDGTFQAPQTYASGGYAAISVALGDVNGDGKPDIVVANGRFDIGPDGIGGIGVLLGNGDGTFKAPQAYSSGGIAATSVALADVNGDGKADIIVTNGCVDSSACDLGVSNGSVGVLLGNGNGTFQAAVTYASGGCTPISVAISDVNGDGKPDVILANSGIGGPCGAAGNVGILPGNGDGTFQAPVTYDSGFISTVYPVAVGDVNGDRKPDFLASSAGQCLNELCVGNAAIGVFINASNPAVVTLAGSPQQPLAKNAAGQYVARVTITNTGNVTVRSLQVTISGTSLGSGSLVSAPAPVRNLVPGGSATVTLTFPANSVSPGTTAAPLKVKGTYSVATPPLSGNWALSFRSVTL